MSDPEWKRAVLDLIDEIIAEIPWGQGSDGYSLACPRKIRSKLTALYSALEKVT